MAPITLSARTGITPTFSLYLSGALVQAGLSMTEIGATGEFWANFPSGSAAGKYLAVFFDGSTKLTSSVVWWDGAAEIFPINRDDIAAIKTKTDSLTFTQSGVLDANIQYVNDVPVKGTGTDADPWNPA